MQLQTLPALERSLVPSGCMIIGLWLQVKKDKEDLTKQWGTTGILGTLEGHARGIQVCLCRFSIACHIDRASFAQLLSSSCIVARYNIFMCRACRVCRST